MLSHLKADVQKAERKTREKPTSHPFIRNPGVGNGVGACQTAALEQELVIRRDHLCSFGWTGFEARDQRPGQRSGQETVLHKREICSQLNQT